MTEVPPYVRRHLASHAADGGMLEEVLDPEKLPYLDPVRVAELLRLTQPPSYSELWQVLGAWRSIRHRLSWEDPRGNAAAFDAALLANGMVPPTRVGPGLTWKPRWSTWMTGGTVVGSPVDPHESRRPYAAFGFVAGHVVLAVGEDSGHIGLWEASTGQLLGEPLRTPAQLGAVAMRGATLAVISRGGQLTIWDATTRALLHEITVDGSPFRSLAIAEWRGRHVVATAGELGQLSLYWADPGDLAMPPIQAPREVRAVALAETSLGLIAALGHGSSQAIVTLWNLDAPESALPEIYAGGEVNAVDLLEVADHELLVAVGTSAGMASVWKLGTDSSLSGWPWQYGPEVRAVALGLVEGQPMLAAGDLDGTVHLGPVGAASADTNLPHPDAITTVEFGLLDGRTMLATACLDGNTRLWDPVQPSAARIHAERRAGSIILVRGPATEVPDVVTGNDEGVVQWWSGAEARMLAEHAVTSHALRIALKRSRDPVADVAAGFIGDRQIALASYEGIIQLLELGHPPRVVHEYSTTGGAWEVVLYVGAGRALFTAREDRSSPVRVYDALTGRPVTRLHAIPERSTVCGFHHGLGRLWLAVTDNDQLLRLIEVSRRVRQLGAPIRTQSGSVAVALGVLEDDDVLAVLTPGRLRLCDAKSGKDRIPPVEISLTAGGVTFARVGARDVVLTSHHSTIRVWNPYTGRKLTQLAFGTPIGGMDVSPAPDGTLTVAVGGPGLLLTTLRDSQLPP